MLTDSQLELLANLIKEEIRSDFSEKHMSGNLMDTISVSKSRGGYRVRVPAEIYNMYQFQMHGVIIPTGSGSYAERLNESGSAFYVYKRSGGRKFVRPGNHVGFVEKAIVKAISRWKGLTGVKSEEEFL